MIRENKQDLVTTKDLCDYYKLTRMTIERLRKRGLPYKIIGTRSVRFDLEEVEQWMQENTKRHLLEKNKQNERVASI